ncbi:SH3 domain-containing protein [Mesorhizobium loti]|uniref:SH3 domain-containing protein n=1 Tax=Mesorhizobium loti R88b TaxID=935548 RepID=A0A6M7WQX5_RHILI|nr:SH3 domain-containing protein [Mesorhizobium loti]QKD02384.1 SH3 domain-containing protein [Mesorhizobium loti R88b]
MKRRTVTLRTTLHALIAVPLLMAARPAIVPAHAEDTPFISIVTGLAPDDLLNVRAKPSAIGKTEARLAAGASVRNLGCNVVDGRPWCMVESDNPKVTGWTPARYLVPVNPAKVPNPDEATPIAAATDASQTPPADGAAAATPPVASAAPAAASVSATSPANPVVAQTETAPPPDLTARLGDVTHMAAPEAPVKSATATAMQDAYGLALAAQDNPTTSEIKSPIQAPEAVAAVTVTPPPSIPVTTAPAATVSAAPVPPTPAANAAEQPVQEAAADPVADADPAADDSPAVAAPGIPVPTPRPDSKAEEPAIDPQTVARVEPTQPLAHAPDATGEIPCARYVGQPMTRCEVSVVRSGGDKADITVTWPDGGTRLISFYAGQPAGSNSRSDFRFTREGTLNMIRVGVAERFEITDSLALGD